MAEAQPKVIRVGIDLGTVNTCVSIFENGDAKVVKTRDGKVIASRVFFDPVTCLLNVGNMAKSLTQFPENTLYDAKRFIGRKFDDPEIQDYVKKVSFNLVDVEKNIYYLVKAKNATKKLSPEDVSSGILNYLRELLESDYEADMVEAVVTVPAYFLNSQNEATKRAIEKSGIKLIQLIKEPTAASLYFIHKYKVRNCTVLVFDLGGGTFDISVIKCNEGNVDVKGTAGDKFLGGRDFDARIYDHICKHYIKNPNALNNLTKNHIMIAAEKIKEKLSKFPEITQNFELLDNSDNLEVKMTRHEFESLCDDLFNKAIDIMQDCLNESKIKKYEIKHVLLVGGSTKIPAIKRKIQEFLPEAVIVDDFNPDEVVAQGAAFLAFKKYSSTQFKPGAIQNPIKNPSLIEELQIKLKNKNKIGKDTPISKNIEEEASVSPSFISEVLSFEIGYELYYGHLKPVFEKNSKIPASKTETIQTTKDNQDCIEIKIYEGKWKNAKANNLLGILIIDKIPPRKAGYQINVKFAIDINNILQVQPEILNKKVEPYKINLDTKTSKQSQIIWTQMEDKIFERIALLKIACYFLIKNYKESNKYDENQTEPFLDKLKLEYEDMQHFERELRIFREKMKKVKSKLFLQSLDDIIENSIVHDPNRLEILVNAVYSAKLKN